MDRLYATGLKDIGCEQSADEENDEDEERP